MKYTLLVVLLLVGCAVVTEIELKCKGECKFKAGRTVDVTEVEIIKEK